VPRNSGGTLQVLNGRRALALRTAPDFLPIADPSSYLAELDLQPSLTSRNAGWEGLLVEQQRKPACALEVPPLLTHFIGIRTGPPGRVVQRREGRTHRGHESYGDIVILPAGVASTWEVEDPTDGLHISLAPELLSRVAAEAGAPEPGRIELLDRFQVRDPALLYLGLALRSELASGCPGGRLFADALATALAAHLLATHATRTVAALEVGTVAPGRLRRAVEYIEHHLETNLTLAEVARAAGLSQFHFCRQFRRVFGLPPHRYIIGLRVQRARRLLARPDIALAEVAHACGFASQSHLSHHFRRLVGVSPGVFRDAQQERARQSKNVGDQLSP